jgi:hypothetical protein
MEIEGSETGAFTSAANIFVALLDFFVSTLKTDNPKTFLSCLGAELSALALLSEKDWRDFSTELLLQLASSELQKLENCLDQSSKSPGFFKDAVSKRLKDIKRLVPSCNPVVPLEFEAYGEKGPALFREYLNRAGELFAAWPLLWRGNDKG